MGHASREKKDSIIKSFKQAGISISPDGTEDTKLYLRGLPDTTNMLERWSICYEGYVPYATRGMYPVYIVCMCQPTRLA